MIPLWKEIEIRQAIEQDPNLPDRNAAARFRTTKQVIARIRKAPALRPREIPKPRTELIKSRRCKECGALLEIWPCPLCRPWAYYYDDVSLEKEERDAEKKAA
jgi:rubrerythrin